MSTDTDLDQATDDSLTDAQLNELFAVEVAGWSSGGWSAWHKEDEGTDRVIREPAFTTDANAVLPWLEKGGEWQASKRQGQWMVSFYEPKGDMYAHLSVAPTFARAAVIALIRAVRASKA
jgi:hypothetical protein